MCFTFDPGAVRHTGETCLEKNNSEVCLSCKGCVVLCCLKNPRFYLLPHADATGVFALIPQSRNCDGTPHLSSCGAYQEEPPGSSAGEQEEPEHTPDCCPAPSLSAYLA